ncbi:MAG TPA: helix-turn-helix transcriptional regulator [Candidatus Nanoarchaeia archaeon]|nr:helix-turn-helix transcriptional regulator [Candidatus Nanoarchaeia archaeon]
MTNPFPQQNSENQQIAPDNCDGILPEANRLALRSLMLNRGLNQARLARALGRDKAFVSRLFSEGKIPKLDVQVRICNLLGAHLILFQPNYKEIVDQINDAEKKKGRPKLILQKKVLGGNL